MNEREILKQSIKDIQRDLDKAKAELTALDKPELRHGDYGYTESGQQRLFVNHNGEIEHYDPDDRRSCNNNYYSDYTILGNIFDDLERNAEDLESFEVDGARFYISPLNNSMIRFSLSNGDERSFSEEEIIEILQKLGRLRATAKKRKR